MKKCFQLCVFLLLKIPSCYSILFDGYWSHIRYDLSISCLLTDIDPILKVFKRYTTDRHDVRSASFPTQTTISNSTNFKFPKTLFAKMHRDFFLNYLESFGVSKVEYNWFGESWTRPKFENHETDDFSGFPKVKSKSYKSEMRNEAE